MEEINTMKLKDNEEGNFDLEIEKISNQGNIKNNNDFNIKNNYITKYSESENAKLNSNYLNNNPNLSNLIYKYYLNKKSLSLYNFSENDRIRFLFERFEKNQNLHCNILLRSNNYYVYSSNTEHFLFSAHKINNKLRVNYIIASDHEGNNKIGQINSSLFRNEYIMYDNGKSPKENLNGKTNNINNLRRYLLQVKIKNENNFKKGFIYLPEVTYENNNLYNIDIDKKDKLSKLEKGIKLYKTEEPEYDLIKRKYLNKFSSRITISSNKNFRLIEDLNKKNKVILECGKIKENAFIMDFSSPLSPIEAFGISLSYLT